MIRQGGQTAAKPTNNANRTADGPPIKVRKTSHSQIAAAEDLAATSTMPDAKKARTDDHGLAIATTIPHSAANASNAVEGAVHLRYDDPSPSLLPTTARPPG